MNPNSTVTKAASTPATASVQRNVVERMNCGWRIASCCPDLLPDVPAAKSRPATRILSSGAEYETRAADIVNHGGFAGTVHLVAQASHVDVDEVGRRNELVIPHFLQKHGSRQQLIAPLHHVFKQAKFSRQEFDHPVASLGGALDQIEFQRSYP